MPGLCCLHCPDEVSGYALVYVLIQSELQKFDSEEHNYKSSNHPPPVSWSADQSTQGINAGVSRIIVALPFYHLLHYNSLLPSVCKCIDSIIGKAIVKNIAKKAGQCSSVTMQTTDKQKEKYSINIIINLWWNKQWPMKTNMRSMSGFQKLS